MRSLTKTTYLRAVLANAPVVPDVDVDHLPARRYGRQIPDGPPPKSTNGWSDELFKLYAESLTPPEIGKLALEAARASRSAPRGEGAQ